MSLADVNSAMQANFGSLYINNFVNGNRVQRVIMQLDAPFRMAPADIGRVYVRNRQGEMVPMSAFTSIEWTYGAPVLQRYNGFPSMEIIGSAPPGKSTGEAMRAMEDMAKQLPAGVGFEWTGQSYEERLSGAQAPKLYALSLVVVFLCLAALYESWIGEAIPPQWKKVAGWRIFNNVVCGDDVVYFYAVDSSETQALTEHLKAFEAQLPRTVAVTYYPSHTP